MTARTTLLKRDANTLATQTPGDAQQVGAVKRQKKSVAQQEDEFDQALDDEALLAAAEQVESAASNFGSSQPEPVVASSSTPTPASAPASPAPPKPTTTTLKQSTLFPTQKGSNSSPSQPAYQPLSNPWSDPLHLERTTMSPFWYSLLSSEFSEPYFTTLKTFLASQTRPTYPPQHLIYNWSRLVPSPAHVRVVVVGQDPYHGPNQACGLSFSVPKGVATPPSLKNIYKELAAEYPGTFKPPNHGCLDGWAKQGVLLLNACLTVSAGQAGSHHGKGWEGLTKRVLKMIADEAANSGAAKAANKDAVKESKIANMFAKVQQKTTATATNSGNGEQKNEKNKEAGEAKTENKGVVFLIWGAPAAKTLAEAGVTEKNPNILILKSPHPSPLSAHRGFLGNGHFKKANEWLKTRYGEEGTIDWTRL